MKYSRRCSTIRLVDQAVSHARLACPVSGGAQKGVKETSMEAVAIEEELWVPLDAEEKAMGG